MTGTVKNIIVGGKIYKVWSDFTKRATFAENETGEVKRIKDSGYISKELTIRKAIALHFNLDNFRK